MKAVLNTLVLTGILSVGLLTTSDNAYAAGVEAKCKACHDFGDKHKLGPALGGIVGKKAGATDFKRYSKSLKNGDWVWDEANLRKWLNDGKAAIKELTGDPDAKTTMPPQRLKDAQLDQIIEFLVGLK
ncbi:MAG: c-type cytochrome [Gammaproteobacteria bacterium]|nr:c-type cytochrome [Gammaproteobacteria bacterium]